MFNKTSALDGCTIEFVDSNYAGDHDKIRSLTSYVYTLLFVQCLGKQHYKLQLIC